MATQLSPGIVTTEINNSSGVTATSSTTGAVAGVFAWGPVLEPTLVSSEVELVRTFGKPVTGFNVETFFTAADFLSYTGALYVSRADTGNTAAPAPGSAAAIAGVRAKYPGAMGNSLRVLMATPSTYAGANAQLRASITSPPAGASAHVVVVDVDGVWTGVANTVLERFESLGTEPSAKTVDGSNNYYVDVINSRSRYVRVEGGDGAAPASAVLANLSGGSNGDSESAAPISVVQTAFDSLIDQNDVDVSLLMVGKSRGAGDVELTNYLTGAVDKRNPRDLMVFTSPAREDVVDNPNATSDVTAFAAALTESSYLVIDSGYKQRYDRYNDRYVWTPLNGDVAGLCARTDETRDPWFSPAGYSRGLLKNVVRLAYNPTKSQRDELYKLSVNPVISLPGQGPMLFGDKTALRTASAFDRIGVRRLFIQLTKRISQASQSSLFEFNDAFTRAKFRNIVEPYLRDVQGRRGVYDFLVVCDETNNTPEVIDGNTLVGDVYVKPARSINFIQLNFVAVRTGPEFTEIVGRG